MIEALIAILLGDPRVLFAARVLAALAALCPCRAPASLEACEAQRRAAADTITVVAWDGATPSEDAALLLGIGAHETGFRTMVQLGGGPAVSWWQLEVPRAERAKLLSDPIAAAQRALRLARGCRGSLRGYATGRCDGGGSVGEQRAKELRSAVASARFFLAR